MNVPEELILKNQMNYHSRNFRYINLLSMIYISFLMAATVMAYKVVNIWGLYEPGSTLIYTFTFFIGNVFAEVYGPDKTKKLIWESIVSGYVFAILITMVTLLPSPPFWNLQKEFNSVLGNVLRFTNAGVIGYLLSSFLNTYLLTKWKYKLKGKYFFARSLMATTVSEGLATFIAGFITFFGMMPNKSVFFLMLNAFSFKILYGLIAVFPATIIAHLLKNKEVEVTISPSYRFFYFK